MADVGIWYARHKNHKIANVSKTRYQCDTSSAPNTERRLSSLENSDTTVAVVLLPAKRKYTQSTIFVMTPTPLKRR